MPTPFQLLLDPVSLCVIAIFASLAAWEALFPARVLPQSPWWRLRGITAFFVYFFVSSYLPLMWSDYLAPLALFDLSGWGIAGGAAAGVLVYEFLVYCWHRTMHGVTPLWRTFHQLHHSAERIDIYGALWFSPLDMAGWAMVSSVALTLIGIAPEAITLVILATSFLAIFQHANIRTPRWLGYFIQRPEAHSLHHARDVHRYNYSDLPIFDMLFGTYRNPRDFAQHSGFYHGASHRLVDMLLFRDVSVPSAKNHREQASAGAGV